MNGSQNWKNIWRSRISGTIRPAPQKIMQELKNLKDTVDEFRGLEEKKEEIEILLEMGYEENDASVIPEIEEAFAGPHR